MVNYQNLLVCVQPVLAWLVGWSDRKNLTDHETSLSAALRQPPGTLNQDSSPDPDQRQELILQGMDLSWCFRVTFTSNEKWLVEDMAAACSALATCPGPGGIFNLTSVQGLKVTISFFFKLRFVTIDILIIGGSKCGPGGDCVQGPCLWWSRTCSSCWGATALSWTFLPGGQDEIVHHEIFF